VGEGSSEVDDLMGSGEVEEAAEALMGRNDGAGLDGWRRGKGEEWKREEEAAIREREREMERRRWMIA